MIAGVMSMSFKRVYIQVLIYATVIVFAAGCASHRNDSCGRLLSQTQILKDLVKKSAEDLVIPREKAEKLGKDYSTVLWILPKNHHVTYDEVDDRMGGYAQAIVVFYKITSPEMNKTCYFNVAETSAFPVTSKGITLRIEHIAPPVHTNLSVEEIFIADRDSLVKSFNKNELEAGGITIINDRTFEFTIPRNNTCKERLWRLNLYYSNEDTYEAAIKDYLEFYGYDRRGMRWPVVKLNFIQLTDSVDPNMMFKQNHSQMLRWVPDTLDIYKSIR